MIKMLIAARLSHAALPGGGGTVTRLKAICLLTLCACAVALTCAAWMVATELSGALRAWGYIPAQIALVLDGDPHAATEDGKKPLRDLLVSRADSQIGALRVDAFAELTALRGDTLSVVREYRTTADARLQSIQNQADRTVAQIATVADSTLVTVNRAADKLDPLVAASTETVKGLQPVLANAKSVTGQIDYALPDYLNCEWNQDCVFNRYQGSAKAFENAMLQAPKFVATTQKTNESVASIAGSVAEFLHPPPVHGFWNRLKQIAKNAKEIAIAALRGGVL